MARRNQVCRGKWLEAWERFLATAEILARRTFYTERLPQNVESVAADRHSPRQVWLRASSSPQFSLQLIVQRKCVGYLIRTWLLGLERG